MKKILKTLYLFLTICLVLPLNVLADCGISPISIKATITNHNGAKLYKNVQGKYEFTGEILEYGSEVIIDYEYAEYANIDKTDENNRQNYFISTNDYKLIGKKQKEVENYITYYAYADTKLRSNPSFNDYEVVTTIPANTYFEIDGRDYNGYKSISDNGTGFALAKYNGKTGWVYVGRCGLENEAITIAEKYEQPEHAYVLGSFYGGNVSNDKAITYNVLGDNSTKKEISLERGKEVNILYTYRVGHNRYYYVTADDIDGIWLTNILLYIDSDTDKRVELVANDVNVEYEVKNFDTLESATSNLEANKVYTYLYRLVGPTFGYVIEDNGVKYLLLDYYGVAKTGEYIGMDSNEDETITNPEKPETQTNNESETINKKTKKVSPIMYVTYCVIATIVLAIVAILAVLFMNKKKEK